MPLSTFPRSTPLLGALAAALLAAACSTTPPPQATGATPATARAPLAVEPDDFRWLEDVQGDKALAWVRQRNAETRARLAGDTAAFERLRDDLRAILDNRDRIPGITGMGDRVYNHWTDAEHPRGVWRRTTLASYRSAAPQWETLVDVDALGKAEGRNWVWKGAQCREPAWDRCMIGLSRGGADATEWREFDLATRSFVAGGFVLPEAKSGLAWSGRDALLVATDFGAGSVTTSGYPRTVKRWARGTPLAAATTVYTGEATDMGVWPMSDVHQGFVREGVLRSPEMRRTQFLQRVGNELRRVDVPETARLEYFGPQMLVTLREDWAPGTTRYRAGSLIAIDEAAFQRGDRAFTVLFEPTAGKALANLARTRNALLVATLEDVKSGIVEWRLAGGTWQSRSVALPPNVSARVQALDDSGSDDYLVNIADFITPNVYQLGHVGSDARETLRQSPAFFDATGLEVTQRFATSADGTRVPYFVVARKDVQRNGRNPTLLYGYGGFEISLSPFYSGGIGRAWLQRGGVYVLANIRGGGEYGPAWHQAALKQNRQRAYDDFAAVAKALVDSGITSPKHLGAMGGSNGGLLAGVALTQMPERFGAIVSQVPLLDMRRYHTMLAGASWMSEYGNPDEAADWAAIQRYSPYHNVHPGVRYPDVLFTTSTRDDRVHPGHARKMVARMLAQGHPNVWYYENIEGGHGGAADSAQRADLLALEYTFLWRTLSRP